MEPRPPATPVLVPIHGGLGLKPRGRTWRTAASWHKFEKLVRAAMSVDVQVGNPMPWPGCHPVPRQGTIAVGRGVRLNGTGSPGWTHSGARTKPRPPRLRVWGPSQSSSEEPPAVNGGKPIDRIAGRKHAAGPCPSRKFHHAPNSPEPRMSKRLASRIPTPDHSI